MAEREVVHAWTAPGASYPEYLNVSREYRGDDYVFILTVRSRAAGAEGPTSQIGLTASEAHQLGWSLIGEAERYGRLVEERRELIRAAGVEGRAESVEAADAITKIKGWRAAIDALYTALRI